MQAVTNAFLQDGQVAIPFELKNDPLFQSMNTDYGFIAACLYNLKIVDGGGFLAAPVCSSWVWVNRATSGRSVSDPLGRWRRHAYVHEANVQVGLQQQQQQRQRQQQQRQQQQLQQQVAL